MGKVNQTDFLTNLLKDMVKQEIDILVRVEQNAVIILLIYVYVVKEILIKGVGFYEDNMDSRMLVKDNNIVR